MPQLSTSNKDICFGQHLNNLCRRNIGHLILAHTSINSIRYKFDVLLYSVKGKVDVIMITETKLDDSFPTMQFSIEGYHTFRLEKNEYGGGILLYVRDDISSKFVPMKNSTIEFFFIELNLGKKKWLLCCTYNPCRSLISNHSSTIRNNIDLLLANYENFFLMDDLNIESHNGFLKEFSDIHNLKNLIKVPTCFKNPDFPISIGVMLTTS